MKIQRLRFSFFTAAISLIALNNMLQNMWAWPEAPWQTNFLFIHDIDHLLSGEMARVNWFEFGTGHALNGYRWLQFVSASFFGLNSHLETVIYWLLMLVTALAVSAYLVRTLRSPVISYGFSALISLVILSPSGAGSRGMEIGQFFGAALIVSFLFLSSRIQNEAWFRLSAMAILSILTFTVLGGYMGGWAVGFGALALFWKAVLRVSEFRRLVFLAIVSSSLTVLYAVLLKIFGANTVSEGPQALLSAIVKDPTFIFKYLLIGNDTALVTSQTFETLPAWANPLIYYVIAGLLVLPTSHILLSFRRHIREHDLFGGALAAYGFGIAVTLLVYRPFGTEWLLSPWYGPHFKIGLAGVVIMAAILTDKRIFTGKVMLVPSALIAIIAIVGSFGWVHQVERQKYEREMFLDIALAEMLPETLKPRSDGLSQLILPMEESKAAIAILEKHNLGVYRDGGFDLKNYPTAGDYLVVGESYDDGWVGNSLSLFADEISCRTLELKIASYKSRENALTYTYSNGDTSRVDIGQGGLILNLQPQGEAINFRLDKSWNPSELGEGLDVRDLSAVVKLKCSP